MSFTIYIDFDGVINVPTGNSKVEIDTKSPYLAKYKTVRWNSEILASLFEVAKVCGAEIVWVTTWGDKQDIVEAVLKMIDIDKVYFLSPKLKTESTNKKDWTSWKAEAIVKDQQHKKSPYVWIDDEALTFWQDYVAGSTFAPSLMIETDSKVGLTKDHLIKMIDWFIEKENWRK